VLFESTNKNIKELNKDSELKIKDKENNKNKNKNSIKARYACIKALLGELVNKLIK